MASKLRLHLESARYAYAQMNYPGDLADLLPPAEHAARRMILSWRYGLAAAAAVAILLLAQAAQLPNASATPAQFTMDDLRTAPKAQLARAYAAVTPADASDWLEAVKRPIADSGLLLVKLGRDLAHQTDALIHAI